MGGFVGVWEFLALVRAGLWEEEVRLLSFEKVEWARLYGLAQEQGVAQCYERPLWRASGDVDLLLDAAGYRRAVDFLSGWAQEVERDDCYKKHWCCKIDGWGVECHGTLMSGLWRSLDKGIDAVVADIFVNGSVRVWRIGSTDVYLPAAAIGLRG